MQHMCDWLEFFLSCSLKGSTSSAGIPKYGPGSLDPPLCHQQRPQKTTHIYIYIYIRATINISPTTKGHEFLLETNLPTWNPMSTLTGRLVNQRLTVAHMSYSLSPLISPVIVSCNPLYNPALRSLDYSSYAIESYLKSSRHVSKIVLKLT